MDKHIESRDELFGRIQSQAQGDDPLSKVITNIGMILKKGSEHPIHRVINMWNEEIKRNGEEMSLEEFNESEHWEDWVDVKKILEGGEAEEEAMMNREVDDSVEVKVEGDAKENLVKMPDEKKEEKVVEENDKKMVGKEMESEKAAKEVQAEEMKLVIPDVKEKEKKKNGKVVPKMSDRAKRAAKRRLAAKNQAKAAKAAQDALPPQPRRGRGRPPKNIKKATEEQI